MTQPARTLTLGQAAPAPPKFNPGQGYRFHTMIKPIGALCNLDCPYCFYLHKTELLGQPGRSPTTSWRPTSAGTSKAKRATKWSSPGRAASRP